MSLTADTSCLILLQQKFEYYSTCEVLDASYLNKFIGKEGKYSPGEERMYLLVADQKPQKFLHLEPTKIMDTNSRRQQSPTDGRTLQFALRSSPFP